MSSSAPRDAVLVLADGSTFEGEWIGAEPPAATGVATGEVVFNTVLTGYQEVLSDPSYAGQILTFTYPHIGNYGTTPTDMESTRPAARGVVVRDLARRRSNWRSDADLAAWLVHHGVPGIAGVDTRRLTRRIREAGAMPGAFAPLDAVELAAVKAAAVDAHGTADVDLVATVTTPSAYTVTGSGRRRIVAYDFGIKSTILRHLASLGTVEVVPASTPAADVLARHPDGVFLSNGPGDPEQVPYAVDAIAGLLGEVPVFGICLGHQLLGLAVGGATEKLPFGHHGGNHPVRPLALREDGFGVGAPAGRIEITSQNHNFAVACDSLAGRAEVTHVNLNDGVCEGLRVTGERAFSVQYHPEAGPGPHDAAHLFTRFAALIDGTAA